MTADQPGSGEQPAGHQTTRPEGRLRRADGTFVPSAETAERDAEAARLYCDGTSYRRIAALLGWAAHSTAQEAVERGLRAIRSVGVVEARTAALERLQESRQVAGEMEEAAREVLAKRHVATSAKGIIWDEEAKPRVPLEDSAPRLAAIDRVVAARKLVLAVDEREAKLLGLDAPAKAQIEMDGGLRYEIVGIPIGDIVGQPVELGGDGAAGVE